MGHFCVTGDDIERLREQAAAWFRRIATRTRVTRSLEIPRFKAWRIHQTRDDFSAGFETLSLDDLSEGEVVIEVACSGVNYKDAMAGTDGAKILRKARWSAA